MTAPEPRICPQCRGPLIRKRYGAKLEDLARFKHRIYCGRACALACETNRRSTVTIDVTCPHCQTVTPRLKHRSYAQFCNNQCYRRWKVGRPPRPLDPEWSPLPPKPPERKPPKPRDISSHQQRRVCPCGEPFLVRRGETRTYHSPACLVAHL